MDYRRFLAPPIWFLKKSQHLRVCNVSIQHASLYSLLNTLDFTLRTALIQHGYGSRQVCHCVLKFSPGFLVFLAFCVLFLSARSQLEFVRPNFECGGLEVSCLCVSPANWRHSQVILDLSSILGVLLPDFRLYSAGRHFS
uniref:Uncharacterized protein n=1 Tax=Strigamia maritima TaxID=126957 RepID=T1IQV2_STRMM